MSVDVCIICGKAQCECGPKKKAKPKRKKPSPSKAAQPAPEQKKQPQTIRPEVRRKVAARPARDTDNLVENKARNRAEESQLFWTAMRNLVNHGMVHEISVKRALDVYPSIPEGL